MKITVSAIISHRAWLTLSDETSLNYLPNSRRSRHTTNTISDKNTWERISFLEDRRRTKDAISLPKILANGTFLQRNKHLKLGPPIKSIDSTKRTTTLENKRSHIWSEIAEYGLKKCYLWWNASKKIDYCAWKLRTGKRRSVSHRAKKPQTTNHNENVTITRPSMAQTKIAPRARMSRPLEIIRTTQGSSKNLPIPAT